MSNCAGEYAAAQTDHVLSEVRYGWVVYDIEEVDRRGSAAVQQLRFGIGFRSSACDQSRGPVGDWSLIACVVAVQACLGSIVYRAGEVYAVGNFANTDNCNRAGVLEVRNGARVTINRFERSMRVVGYRPIIKALQLGWHSKFNKRYNLYM